MILRSISSSKPRKSIRTANAGPVAAEVANAMDVVAVVVAVAEELFVPEAVGVDGIAKGAVDVPMADDSTGVTVDGVGELELVVVVVTVVVVVGVPDVVVVIAVVVVGAAAVEVDAVGTDIVAVSTEGTDGADDDAAAAADTALFAAVPLSAKTNERMD